MNGNNQHINHHHQNKKVKQSVLAPYSSSSSTAAAATTSVSLVERTSGKFAIGTPPNRRGEDRQIRR